MPKVAAAQQPNFSRHMEGVGCIYAASAMLIFALMKSTEGRTDCIEFKCIITRFFATTQLLSETILLLWRLGHYTSW